MDSSGMAARLAQDFSPCALRDRRASHLIGRMYFSARARNSRLAQREAEVSPHAKQGLVSPSLAYSHFQWTGT